MQRRRLLRQLIDGLLVAFTGTNKERKRWGIGNIIAIILMYVAIWFGLRCLGYKSNIAIIDISAPAIENIGRTLGAIVGIVIIVIFGIGAVVAIITIFALFISSLVKLIKGTIDDEKPLASFIVNLVGLIITIVIPILFLI